MRTAFGYIGITQVYGAAVENDEFGGARLQESIARAKDAVDALVARLSEAR